MRQSSWIYSPICSVRVRTLGVRPPMPTTGLVKNALYGTAAGKAGFSSE